MSIKIDEIADLDPFEMIKRAKEADGEFVRVEVTLHPFRGKSKSDFGLTHRPWIVDGIGEHFHPVQKEIFTVRAGELYVELEGSGHTLTADERISLPADIPHRHWNPADQPARVLVEHRPACQSDVLLETLFTLAQAGKTDERGIPGLLQSVVLQQAFADHAYGTDRPVIVQKALGTLLAPIGRLAGYKAAHSVDEIEALQ